MTVWKVSVQSGKFLESLENFWTVWKVLHFWHTCCRNFLRTSSGKFLRVRKVFTRTTLSPKTSQTWHKFLDSLESFLTVWKASEQTGEYPDSLESVRKFWKVSGQSGKFPDSLESFRTVGKVSDSLEIFQKYGNFPKVSKQFGKFLDSFVIFWTIYALLYMS